MTSLVSRTSAPGTTLPVPSKTTPEMLPVTCANAGTASESTNKTNKNIDLRRIHPSRVNLE
jgi:hypothetical protein